MTASPAQDRLSMPRLVAFSLPGFSIGALAVALAVYLPHYYAAHFGLALAAVGAAFGIVRFGDTFIDPLIGLFMDRTRTRIGRYRVWMLAGAPLLMLAVYMLFDPPYGVSMPYLAGWLLAYYIGWSLILLSLNSWASVIAGKYHERSRVFGAIQVVSTLGAALVLLIPALMARRGATAGAVPAMGWFIVIAAPVGVAAATLLTREPIPADSHAERFGFRDYWEMVCRPDMARIIISDFCLYLGPGWMSAMYIFYFHDARGFSVPAASSLLLIYIAAGVVGAAGLSWLAQRIGKHRAMQVAATGYSLMLGGTTLLPNGDYPLAAALLLALGFLAAGFTLLDRAMVADVADAVRLEKGKQRTGLLYAMISTTQKLAASASILLSFTVLGAIGYNAKEGVANTPAAIHGMELVYIITPIVFVMLGGACYFGYGLDAKRHADIRAQLDALDAGTAEPPVLGSLNADVSVAARPSV